MNPSEVYFPSFIYAMQMLGVAVLGCSGALTAGRKSLDLIGVIIIALATALGGGTLRDLLLDRNPVFWIADPMYLWVTAGAGLLTWIYASFRPPPQKALDYADTVGLGLFTIIGARIAEQTGQSVVICCVMGVITGTAGGVVRDIFCREIPVLFRRSPLYATAAAIGTVVFFCVKATGVPAPLASLSGIITIIALRLAAQAYGWHLPVFHFRDQQRDE